MNVYFYAQQQRDWAHLPFRWAALDRSHSLRHFVLDLPMNYLIDRDTSLHAKQYLN